MSEMRHLLSNHVIACETKRVLASLFDEPGFQDDHITAFVSPPMMLLFHRTGVTESRVRMSDLAMSLDEFSARFIVPLAHFIQDRIWRERRKVI
jgi:hypothetical protein